MIESAAAVDLETYRATLTGHCYRMLGSVADADDAVQETMIRAVRALPNFEGRSALRTWLHRIATHVCLDALAQKKRRELPAMAYPAGTVHDELAPREPDHWLEPVPDQAVLAVAPDRHAILRQSVRLAFVAALQHLPPRQRAALLLLDVVGLSAAEAAECLDTSAASINSALQRARATLQARDPAESRTADEPDPVLLERFVEAFERYDVTALKALLRDDVIMSMPPFSLWLRGPTAVGDWLLGRGIGCQGSRLVPTAANGMPAFAQYHPVEDGYAPWALLVLEPAGKCFASLTFFLDVERLFPRFNLPPHLPHP